MNWLVSLVFWGLISISWAQDKQELNIVYGKDSLSISVPDSILRYSINTDFNASTSGLYGTYDKTHFVGYEFQCKQVFESNDSVWVVPPRLRDPLSHFFFGFAPVNEFCQKTLEVTNAHVVIPLYALNDKKASSAMDPKEVLDLKWKYLWYINVLTKKHQLIPFLEESVYVSP